MGIRVHKILGYYFQAKFSKKTGEISDKRINKEKLNKFNYDIYQDDEFINKFLDWNQKNKDLCIKIINNFYNLKDAKHGEYLWDLSFLIKSNKNKKDDNNFFFMSSEYGKKGLLFFKPLFHHEWYRYDDIIDYYISNRNPVNKIKKINNGIYPYLGHMYLKSNAPKYTGENTQIIINQIDIGFYNQLIGCWDKKLKPILENEEDIKYLKNYYKPTIESSVLLLIYYSEIFNNFEDSINELVPAIYTYWS